MIFVEGTTKNNHRGMVDIRGDTQSWKSAGGPDYGENHRTCA